MATALDLIKRAMRLTRALGIGETPSAAESTDCLEALNAMLDGWRLDRLLIFGITEDTKTLTIGDGSYTIGSSGDINTTRPERLAEGSYVRVSGVDYPLAVLDASAWSSISLKTQRGIPVHIYYQRANPFGTVNLWPLPDAAYELHLLSYKAIQSFSALTDSVTLPAGYEDAIAYSLAERIAPEGYGAISPETIRLAKQARDRLIAGNAPRMIMRFSNDLADVGLYRNDATDIATR